MASHDEPVEISVDGELIAGRFITPGTLIPGASALYIDTDWDRPKLQLHREQDLVGYRRSFVPAASNQALRACSEFAGDVLADRVAVPRHRPVDGDQQRPRGLQARALVDLPPDGRGGPRPERRGRPTRLYQRRW
jgi:hypothetical protein